MEQRSPESTKLEMWDDAVGSTWAHHFDFIKIEGFSRGGCIGWN